MGLKSQWSAWRDDDGTLCVRAQVTKKDQREMSARQLEDFCTGVALIAASYRADDQFPGGTAMDRASELLGDEQLEGFV